MTANELHDSLRALLEPALDEVRLELVDVSLQGALLQVLVERNEGHPLGGRIDLDGVAEATRIVDEVLEVSDPIAQAYTLEVSSPGLERPLRTPAHFSRFVGATISVKLVAGGEGERRVEGRLDRADSDPTGSINVNGRAISYADIDRARTVFEWGGQPKGAKKGAKGASGVKSANGVKEPWGVKQSPAPQGKTGANKTKKSNSSAGVPANEFDSTSTQGDLQEEISE